MSAANLTPPEDLYITADLQGRPSPSSAVDHLSEKLALQELAAHMLDRPDLLLPKLVERAMEATGSTSAGISEFAPDAGGDSVFRWRDLHGELAQFEGATTPRNFSPCGVCIDRLEATLTKHPERYYDWISDAGVVCPEVLLVPLVVAHEKPLGTLWVVSAREGQFDRGHAKSLEELASFVGIALAMVKNQSRLQESLAQQEMLAREMDHRVNNAFFVIDAMIHVGKKSAASAEAFAETLSGRLHALASAHKLARIGAGGGPNIGYGPASSFKSLLQTILAPYDGTEHQRFVLNGEDFNLADRAISGLALVFHELATNAAKYGALAGETGRLSISWTRGPQSLSISWVEQDGATIIAAPSEEGFGSTLLRNTLVRQFGGTSVSNWRTTGLAIELTLPLSRIVLESSELKKPGAVQPAP